MLKPLLGAQINWTHPLVKGLILDMPFFEGSGSISKADYPLGFTGTLTNSPTWVSDNAGKGINFVQASSQYLSLSNNPSANLNGITIEALINVSLPQTTGFVFFNGNDFAGYGMAVGATSDGSGSKLIGLNGGLAWVDSATTLTSNIITHVALTIDSSNVWTFYATGKPDNRGAQTAVVGVTGGKATVGCELNSSNVATRFINGKVFYTRMWNRVLSARDIASLSANPFQIYLKRAIPIVVPSIASWNSLTINQPINYNTVVLV